MSALEVAGIEMHFGGLRTLRNVSLQVESGERRVLIGANGAGKTTLLNVISGMLPPAAGQVRLLGRDVSRLSPNRRSELGMARTFQITNLLPRMTVRQNVAVAIQSRLRAKYNLLRPWATYRDIWREADAVIEEWGLAGRAGLPVAKLAYGEQRILEIVMAVATGPRVLLLDEPTAGLSVPETAKVAELMERLDPDLAILFIEHDMEIAFRLAHQVTVLHFGEVLTEGTPETIRANPRVQEIYFGADSHA